MDEKNLATQYLDAINTAIEIHTKNAVAGLQFNRTETATIVGERDDNGFYPVYNGSIRYMAKSEKANYKKGTTVYVTIPNNDTSQEKYIIGMLRDKDGKGLAYTSPLQRYAPDNLFGNLIGKKEYLITEDDEFWSYIEELEGVTVNLNYNPEDETGLVANFNLKENQYDKKEYELLYLTRNLKDTEAINTKNYKYIGLSADFKTLLNAFHTTKGDYGIQIFIQYSRNQEGNEANRLYDVITYRLSALDMIGAVYNFNTFYNQEALFQIDNDVESGVLIHRIGVMFYQDNNFENYDGKINTLYEQNHLKNIFMKSLSIQFGDDLPDAVTDEATIYTTNGQFYDSAQLNEKLNEKRVYLKWKHLDYENEDNGLVEVTSLNKNVSTETDLVLKPKVTWYMDSLRTLADFRAEEAEAAAENERLYALLEKYKNSIENRDAWIADWEEKFQEMINNEETYLSNTEVINAYTELREENAEKYGANTDNITREEMYQLITEMHLKSTEDYYYNMETQQYYLTPAGEKCLDRAITRNAKSGLSEASSSEDGGEYWVPIGSDALYVDFDPDIKRNECRIKCIIEYGPETEQKTLDRESSYYKKVVSNIILFKNRSAVPDPNTQDAAIGVKLYYNDGSNGDYPLYDGQTGKILNNNDYSEDRWLYMDFISKYSGKSYLNGNESIIWQVPKSNTMIEVLGPMADDEVSEYSTRRLLTEDDAEELQEKYLIDCDFNNYYYIRVDCYNEGNANVKVYNELHYQISEFYTQSATNNTITCYLLKNNQRFDGTTTMYFSHKGTNGTDYTFTLGLGDLVDTNWNVVGGADAALTIGERNYRRIKFELFDADCKKIDLTNEEKNAIINLWVTHKADGYFTENLGYSLDFITQRTLNNYTDVAVRIQNGVRYITEDLKYIILQASLKSDTTSTYNDRIYGLDNVLFTQYLPIPIKTNKNYHLNGSGIIFYDDQGKIAQNTNGARYDLLNRHWEPHFTICADAVVKAEIFDGVVQDIEGDDIQYYPQFTAEYRLQPTSVYFKNIASTGLRTEKARKLSIDAYDGDILSYTLPLMILQNRYQIPGLNRWNGKLLIDSDNNQIMAATISAGRKEADNSFTGTIMGDVKKSDDSLVSGLFGYHQGSQAFGFQTDGTGFIGKSTTGRINFDGTKGLITSANYSVDQGDGKRREGTRIDLDNGDIDMYGYGNTYEYMPETKRWVANNANTSMASHVHLSTQGTTRNPYFQIEVPQVIHGPNGDDDLRDSITTTQNLLLIDKNNYYLQTADYSSETNTGLKIDLKRGTFDSKGRLTINGGLGSSIYFGTEQDHVSMGVSLGGLSHFEMVTNSVGADSIATRLSEIQTRLADDFSGLSYSPYYSNYKINNENNLRIALQNLANTIADSNRTLTGLGTQVESAREEYNNAYSVYQAAVVPYNEKMLQIAECDRILALDNSSAIVDADNKYTIWQSLLNELPGLEATYQASEEALVTAEQNYADAQEFETNATNEYNNATNLYNSLNAELEELVAQKQQVETDLADQVNWLATWQELLDQENEYPSEGPTEENPDAMTHDEAVEYFNANIATCQNNIDNYNTTLASLETSIEEKTTEVNAARTNWKAAYTELYGDSTNNILSAAEKTQNALTARDNARNTRNDAYNAVNDKNIEINEAKTNYDTAAYIRDNLASQQVEAQVRKDSLLSSNDIEQAYETALADYEAKKSAYENLTVSQASWNDTLIANQQKYDNGLHDLEEYLAVYQRYEAALSGGAGDGHIRISNSGSHYIEAGSNFWVDSRGNIMSSGGTIAGWRISDSSLTGGSMHINSNGSMSGSGWHIDANGNAYFNNVFQAGSATGYNSGTGLYVNGGSAYFNGDIYARHGYFSGSVYATDGVFNGTIYASAGTFTGTINASTINGGTISGTNISGGTITGSYISGGTVNGARITGGSISVTGHITCAGLTVGGRSYGMVSAAFVRDFEVHNTDVVSSVYPTYGSIMGATVVTGISTGTKVVSRFYSTLKQTATFLGSVS